MSIRLAIPLGEALPGLPFLVAFFVIIGTYLGSAVIAQVILMMLKQI